MRFPGQYYDNETGLHYNWHRYYDPSIGRYLRSDPIGFFGGDVNLFAYVLNNPVNAIDPDGRAVHWIVRFIYGRLAAALLNQADRGDDSTSWQQQMMDEGKDWDGNVEMRELFDQIEEIKRWAEEYNRIYGPQSDPCREKIIKQ